MGLAREFLGLGPVEELGLLSLKGRFGLNDFFLFGYIDFFGVDTCMATKLDSIKFGLEALFSLY